MAQAIDHWDVIVVGVRDGVAEPAGPLIDHLMAQTRLAEALVRTALRQGDLIVQRRIPQSVARTIATDLERLGARARVSRTEASVAMPMLEPDPEASQREPSWMGGLPPAHADVQTPPRRPPAPVAPARPSPGPAPRVPQPPQWSAGGTPGHPSRGAVGGRRVGVSPGSLGASPPPPGGVEELAARLDSVTGPADDLVLTLDGLSVGDAPSELPRPAATPRSETKTPPTTVVEPAGPRIGGAVELDYAAAGLADPGEKLSGSQVLRSEGPDASRSMGAAPALSSAALSSGGLPAGATHTGGSRISPAMSGSMPFAPAPASRGLFGRDPVAAKLWAYTAGAAVAIVVAVVVTRMTGREPMERLEAELADVYARPTAVEAGELRSDTAVLSDLDALHQKGQRRFLLVWVAMAAALGYGLSRIDS